MEEENNQPIGHMEAYFNTVNSMGIVYNNPSLRYNMEEDFSTKLDTKDPTFLSLYEAADGEGKQALLGATSVSHAEKIAERRDIFAKSQEIVSQDPVLMQFAIGTIPALLDPVNTIPVMGAATKAFGVAKTASRLSRIGRTAVAGSVAGAAGNIATEALLDAQGIQTDYLGAAMFGMAFGGTLGGIGATMAGPHKMQVAKAMTDKEMETHFESDPMPTIKVQEDGTVKIEKAEGIENIGQMPSYGLNPVLDFLRSDSNIMYQSNSTIMRQEASKITPATVSLKDSDGNIIPTKKTGVDDRYETDGVLNTMINEVTKDFDDARQNGYKGSREQFVQEITDAYTHASKEQEFKAYELASTKTEEITNKMEKEGKTPEQIIAKVESTFRKELNKAYDEIEVKFGSNNQHVNLGAEKYRNYYNSMLERGQSRSVQGLKNLSTSKLYRPRVYDYKAIKQMDPAEVYTMIQSSLASHPNQAGVASSTLDLAAQELIEQLIKGTFSLDYLTTTFVASNNVPFDSMLKQRKWKLDETKLGPIIKTNLDDVTGAYHYKMRGRQALAFTYGHDDMAKISQEFEDKLVAEGNKHTKRELQAFNRTLEDLVGTLRMNQLSDTPKWTFTRNLTSLNSVRLGGGFGGNQFIELASAVLMNGMTGIFNGRFGKTLTQTARALYTNKGVDDSFSKTMINAGFLGDVLHQHKANRYSDTEAGFNSGVIENKLQGLNEKLMKYNGMRYFMGVMEDMTGGAIMEQLSKFAKMDKLSGANEARLARWGLTHSQAKSLAKEIDTYYRPAEGIFELDKFSEVNRDRFQLAISRGIEEIVVQGDSIHLPGWMKAPGAATKLFTQFMRFPLIANSTLLQRGLTEDKARLASGAIASMATYMGLKYLREEATIQLGLADEMDRKYDYFGYNGQENRMRALQESLNYTAQLGMFTTGFNLGATTFGYEELGRDYATNRQAEALYGPTFGGTVPSMLSIMKDIGQGNWDSKTTAKAKSFVPFNNLPIVNEGLNHMIKEGL